MITVNVIYTGGTLGRFKNEPMWAVTMVKVRHGKVNRKYKGYLSDDEYKSTYELMDQLKGMQQFFNNKSQ